MGNEEPGGGRQAVGAVRILCCFRVTPDFETLRESEWVAGAAGVVETTYVRRIINCFDESALELALRLVEALAADGVAASAGALSVGGREVESHLKTLLALGFEGVARVEPPAPLEFSPGLTASLITRYVRRMDDADLVVTGWRCGPGDSGVVPFLVAEGLGRPCVTQVTGLEPLGAERLRVTCAADDGLLRLTVRPPCVLAVGNAAVSHLRVPTLTDRLATNDRMPVVLSAADLGVGAGTLCEEGSLVPAGLEPIDRHRAGVVIAGDSPREKARALFDTCLRDTLARPDVAP